MSLSLFRLGYDLFLLSLGHLVRMFCVWRAEFGSCFVCTLFWLDEPESGSGCVCIPCLIAWCWVRLHQYHESGCSSLKLVMFCVGVQFGSCFSCVYLTESGSGCVCVLCLIGWAWVTSCLSVQRGCISVTSNWEISGKISGVERKQQGITSFEVFLLLVWGVIRKWWGSGTWNNDGSCSSVVAFLE